MPRLDLAPLAQPRFRVLLAARVVSMAGNVLGPLGLTFGVLGLPGATPVDLSVVLAANLLPRLVLVLLGGVIGDRLPRYRVLVAGESLAAVAYAALALLILTAWAPLGLLVGAAALAGVASALSLPSLVGVVPEVVGRDGLQEANALLKLGTNAASIAGLAAGGTLVAALGPGWALAADAATYAVSATLLWRLRLPADVPTKGRSVTADLAQGWREFAGRTWLWSVVTAAAFLNAGSRVTFGLAGPVIARDRMGGAGAWAAVLGAYSVGMVLGVLVALRSRPSRPLRRAVGVAAVLSLPALALGLALPLPVVLVAALLAGVASDVFGVLWATTFQREVPEEASARVSAYEWLGALSLAPLAVVVAGPFVAAEGPEPTLLVTAGVMAAAPLLTLAVPAVHRIRAAEPVPDQKEVALDE